MIISIWILRIDVKEKFEGCKSTARMLTNLMIDYKLLPVFVQQ